MGRKEFESMSAEERCQREGLQISNDGLIEVSIRLELPRKFEKLLDSEENWANACKQN
jgi:hypothetical protein